MHIGHITFRKNVLYYFLTSYPQHPTRYTRKKNAETRGLAAHSPHAAHPPHSPDTPISLRTLFGGNSLEELRARRDESRAVRGHLTGVVRRVVRGDPDKCHLDYYICAFRVFIGESHIPDAVS